MNRNQRPFFALPEGDVCAVGPDATQKTYGDRVCNGLADADYVYGGQGSVSGGGAFNEYGKGHGVGHGGYSSNGDVSSATPRKRPDYGGLID